MISEPDKPANGHRHYAVDDVRRVRFIKRVQVLGFTLEEIGTLLELDEAHAFGETSEFAMRKLQIIEVKVSDLKAMRKASTSLLRECDMGKEKGELPDPPCTGCRLITGPTSWSPYILGLYLVPFANAPIQFPLLESHQLLQPLLMETFFRALGSTKHCKAARDHSPHEAQTRDAARRSHGSRERCRVVQDNLSKALW